MKWFKHDTDANRDSKMEKVLMKYGADGYALYWLCLELIAAPIDKHNINFELKHDAEILGHRLKIDSVRVEEIMRYFIGLNLFELDSTSNRITCLKLANRIENSIVKNPQLLEIQKLISQQFPDDPGSSGTIPDLLGKSGLDTDTDTDLDKNNKNKPGPKKSGLKTLRTFLDECQAQGIKAIPEDHAVWKYAEGVQIDPVMVRACWYRFKHAYLRTEKKYSNWGLAFLNCMKGNYYKIWYVDASGAVLWSSAGNQARKAMENDVEADL